MTLVYFDSSALVKLVIGEAGTELAVELWDGCDAALASRLAYPEVRAALAAAVRNHDLDNDKLAAAEDAWEGYWAAVRPVELTPAVERRAGDLAGSTAFAARTQFILRAPWLSESRTLSWRSGTGDCTREHEQRAPSWLRQISAPSPRAYRSGFLDS